MTEGSQAPAGSVIWSSPDSIYSIYCSRPVLQEIEFLVKEASNRISYGGLEIGGLLFGRLPERPKDPIKIEAFGSIDCEHVYGPTFKLSDRDIAAMRTKLVESISDPELDGLQSIGWFISHSRNPLLLNEQEESLFQLLFPQPGQLTLLVKPERFKPTQFAFLVRSPDGSVPKDGTQFSSAILASAVPASSPAPTSRWVSPDKRRLEPAPIAAVSVHEPPKPVEKVQKKELEVKGSQPRESQSVPIEAKQKNSSVESAKVADSVKRKEEPAFPEQEIAPVSQEYSEPTKPLSDSSSPSAEEAKKRREELLSAFKEAENQLWAGQGTQDFPYLQRRRRVSSPGIWIAVSVFVAIALYCGYARLFLSVLPLDLQVIGNKVTVSWPGEDNGAFVTGAVRINNGPPLPLSPEQKVIGRREVPVEGDDVKIEVVIHHWSHDMRGIVRYVKAPSAP